MTNINVFLKILEQEISKTNNAIEKINMASSLTKIIDLITKETIWELTEDDLEKLDVCLAKQNQLTPEEKEFLRIFVGMPKEIKALKKRWGLGLEQEVIIEEINSKIRAYQAKEFSEADLMSLENLLKEYKILLGKLKNNDVNLITELELVSNIMNKNKIPFTEQIKIYREINKINNEIFRKYNLSLNDVQFDETELSEKDLTVTNLPKEMLQILFEEFNINWKINYDERTTEEEKKNKEDIIIQWKQKLLKYGDFEKMRSILQFLKQNNLEFVFELPEVLSLTLLYSTKEQLKKLIEKGQSNNLEMNTLIKNNPTLLYPTIRDLEIKIKRKRGRPSSEDSKTKSGELKHFINCVEFLESHNYNVEEVYKNCSTLFSRSIRTIIKAYESFKTYGVDLDILNQSNCFSVLMSTNVLDKLDIALECGCLEYYKINLSSFTKNEVLPYKIKLATSKGVSYDDIFGTYASKMSVRKKFRESNEYGSTKDEIFQKYNVYSFDDSNKDLYDAIIRNSDNSTISILSTNDSIIEKLDSMYKVANSNIYNFDGVIISRLKVLRYYETLITSPDINSNKDVLMYAITVLSMLNEEEYMKIKRCVDQIKLKERIL